MRQGLVRRDLAANFGTNGGDQGDMYADDAEISIVDQRHTPSDPQALDGRDQIRAFLSDVFGGDMKLASAVLDIDAGRIVRPFSGVADEVPGRWT